MKKDSISALGDGWEGTWTIERPLEYDFSVTMWNVIYTAPLRIYNAGQLVGYSSSPFSVNHDSRIYRDQDEQDAWLVIRPEEEPQQHRGYALLDAASKKRLGRARVETGLLKGMFPWELLDGDSNRSTATFRCLAFAVEWIRQGMAPLFMWIPLRYVVRDVDGNRLATLWTRCWGALKVRVRVFPSDRIGTHEILALVILAVAAVGRSEGDDGCASSNPPTDARQGRG